jgi:hypothetical protein
MGRRTVMPATATSALLILPTAPPTASTSASPASSHSEPASQYHDEPRGTGPGYDPAVLFPAECDRPLRAPPSRASVLAYRADLAAVRTFTAMHASGAGMSPHRVSDLVLAVSELAANTPPVHQCRRRPVHLGGQEGADLSGRRHRPQQRPAG